MTKASDVRAALLRKYCLPEWFLAFEVADGTGTAAKRWADAVAMSIWPSRGHQINGFEIKVSRGDFLSEMKAPEKADAVMRYCDHWWLVVPMNMVAPEEIPPTWGLMDVTASGLRVRKQAPKLEAQPITRAFMSALIRRSRDMEQEHIQAAIGRGEAERQAAMQREIEWRTKDLREKLAERAQWARDFEAAFGQPPRSYSDPAKMAATIRAAEKLCGEWGVLHRIQESAQALIREIDDFKSAQRVPAEAAE